MAEVITRKCMEPGCDERVQVKSNRKKVKMKGGVLAQFVFARCKKHNEVYEKAKGGMKDEQSGQSKPKKATKSKYFSGKRG